MRFAEFRSSLVEKKLGRTFNHLEDLVFFHGTSGTVEALEHLKEMATEEGSRTIRMKWDGNPQIYWGREVPGGPLILTGHNAWTRGAKATTKEDIIDFIVNKSGNPKTPADVAARQEFAESFANLYNLFDEATPSDFVGFVYADGLFLEQPNLNEGVYEFSPNPRSATTYHVKEGSNLGQRIAKAKVMAVGHAYFKEFGMPDYAQEPKSRFDEFNSNSDLIILGPVYNSTPVKVNLSEVNEIEEYTKQHAKQIDTFLESVNGLSDLKNIIYTYVNQTAKKKQLESLSSDHFFDWIKESKVSTNKQKKIHELNQQHNNVMDIIFTSVKRIQQAKDHIIEQVEGKHGDIWDTNGEGRVRYACEQKKHGHIKLVPRKRWVPA